MISRISFVLVFVFAVRFASAQGAPSDTLTAYQRYMQAIDFEADSKFDTAIVLYKQTADAYREAGVWYTYIKVLNRLAYMYAEYFKQTAVALQYSNESIALSLQHFGAESSLTAESYVSQGVTYLNMTFYPLQAIGCFSKAEKVIRQRYGDTHIRMARIYSLLSTAYSELNSAYSQQKSMEYMHRAIALRSELSGSESEAVGGLYLLLASRQCGHFNQHAEGLANFAKAEYILQKHCKPDNYWLIACRENIIIFKDTLNEADVLFTIDRLNSYTTDQQHSAIFMGNKLVEWYLANNQLDSAIYYYHKVLSIANLSNQFALDKLAALSIADNSMFEAYGYLFDARCNILRRLYASTHHEKYAQHYFDVVQQYDSILNINRLNHVFDQNNQAQSVTHKKYHQGIFEVCYSIVANKDASASLRSKAVDVALSASDRFKALSLTESNGLLRYLGNEVGNSDSLNTLRALKKAINAAEILFLTANTDTERMQFLDSLSQFRNHYTLLMQYFVQTNSNIAHEINKTKELNYQYLKDKLDAKTAIRTYYTGQGCLYLISITKASFDIQKIETPADFDAKLNTFRNMLIYGYIDSDVERYKQLSHELQALLFPPLPAKIKNVVIVPDNNIGLLPFETLTFDNNTKTDFGKLNYLGQRYNISYAYSISEYLAHQHKSQSNYSVDFMAFAPVFSAETNEIYLSENTRRCINEICRSTNIQLISNNNIVALPGSKAEVRSIEQLLQRKNKTNRIFLENAATKKCFYSESQISAKYLHIATHGFSNAITPQLSGILLMPEATDPNKTSGILYANEIETMQLNVDLLALSACETGFGAVNKGEGLIGLPRAFMLAGANNVVSSLWKVSDASTSQLMVAFYRNMSSTNSYATALRRAKTEVMKMYPHPFYWSGFVLLGQ